MTLKRENRRTSGSEIVSLLCRYKSALENMLESLTRALANAPCVEDLQDMVGRNNDQSRRRMKL
jgi:hypothetical protein